VSNSDSDLINPIYLIKISEFFKIHFNPYGRIKTKQFLFFSIPKNMQTINSF